jgi:16S rRNA (uracil1498-N3)-methyltransferase
VTAPHFFVDHVEPTRVSLSEFDSRHALGSLRLRPGDALTVADGGGLVGRGRLIVEPGPRHRSRIAAVEIEEIDRVGRRPPRVSVVLAPPAGDRLSWTVQKLGELGVDELALLRTERTVRRVDPLRAGSRLDRLRMIAREAAMQSRQAFIMEVPEPRTLDDALHGDAIDAAPTRDHETMVLLWEGDAEGLPVVLPEGASAVRLLVGPEGGFTDDEVERATSANAVMASLGRSILRTETAALVGAVLTLARYGRLG